MTTQAAASQPVTMPEAVAEVLGIIAPQSRPDQLIQLLANRGFRIVRVSLADADLIAAAPELFEALTQIADKHVGDPPASVHHNEAEWVWQHIREVRAIARAALAAATGGAP